MAAINTRGDALIEYLTGASADNVAQTDPTLSLGGNRSSTEATSFGITIANAISNLIVTLASGGNPIGSGTLTALNATDLTWQAPGATIAGQPTTVGVGSGIVEAASYPGQFLRVTGSGAFSVGQSQITLSPLMANLYGFPILTIAQVASGISHYRAGIIRNVSPGIVGSLTRCLSLLGTPQTPSVASLPSSGAGLLTVSSLGTFSDWPLTGWCQIRNSLGVLKEVVYYAGSTNTTLAVAATGRGLLGTTAVVGAIGDIIYPVPGIAIALDPAGVLTSGSSIETIPDQFTPPSGVTWNLEITAAGGLSVPTLNPTQQIGIWMWRQCPPGMTSTPSAIVKVSDTFTAY